MVNGCVVVLSGELLTWGIWAGKKNQSTAQTAVESARPIHYSVSDSVREWYSYQHPPHAHAPRSRMHTGPWFFFATKPWPLRQQILRDLLTKVYLTSEYHRHLLYPPSVWETSISSSLSSSSVITPTPFTSFPTSFRFIRYMNTLKKKILFDRINHLFWTPPPNKLLGERVGWGWYMGVWWSMQGMTRMNQVWMWVGGWEREREREWKRQTDRERGFDQIQGVVQVFRWGERICTN